MARAGFYNENLYRDYPFVTDTGQRTDESSEASETSTRLPRSAIVDAGAVLGVATEYDDQADRVYLYAIRHVGSEVIFELRTTDESADDEALLFAFPDDCANFSTLWVESRPLGTSASVSVTDCQAPKWEGFLVVGDLTEILAILADTPEMHFGGDWQLMPARVQNLRDSYVRGVSLANVDRTKATAYEDCLESSSAAEEAETIVSAECLTGQLALRPGFNCVIRQAPENNSFEIGALVGAGLGEPCEEVPLYENEPSPDGGNLLTGGPRCDEVVRTLNGKGGPILQIIPGPGFSVAVDESDASRLVITADMRELAVCIPEATSSEGA